MKLAALADHTAVDRADALTDVLTTPQQWREARQAAPGALDLSGVEAVVVTGMGGSGITGDVLWCLATEAFDRPLVVHKGYGLPAWVGASTLVLAISYSGSTEETVSAEAEAKARGARRFVVAGGGPLAASAGEDGTPCVGTPPGRQPRHSLGYLLVPALFALGLDEGYDEALEVMDSVAARAALDVDPADDPIKQLATDLADAATTSLILGGRGAGAVAGYRLKCQLAENAKLPALLDELPEANHNDVVAWQEQSLLTGATGLISVRDRLGEHERTALRFDITEDLLADRVTWHHQLESTGTSALARLSSLLLQADLVSVYAAIALDRDPTPIPFIDSVKKRLADAAVAGR